MSDRADIRELAVAAWRLEKWLDNLNSDRKMAAKSALRSIKKYINASGVEVKDPIGSKFDPGLAVEVVNNEADGVDEENLIIIETLAPYVYQNGELLQHARVIIGTAVKEAKPNNEILESTEEPSVQQEAPSDATPSSEKAGEETAEDVVAEQDKSITIDENDIERMMRYAKIF